MLNNLREPKPVLFSTHNFDVMSFIETWLEDFAYVSIRDVAWRLCIRLYQRRGLRTLTASLSETWLEDSDCVPMRDAAWRLCVPITDMAWWLGLRPYQWCSLRTLRPYQRSGLWILTASLSDTWLEESDCVSIRDVTWRPCVSSRDVSWGLWLRPYRRRVSLILTVSLLETWLEDSASLSETWLVDSDCVPIRDVAWGSGDSSVVTRWTVDQEFACSNPSHCRM